MKLLSISLLTTRSKAHVERGYIVVTILSAKQRNASAPNSLDKLMILETNCCNRLQLISLGSYKDDLEWGKRTNLHKFQKKPLSRVLTWIQLFAFNDFEIFTLVFCYIFFLCCLMTKLCYLNHSRFSLPFFLSAKSPIFAVIFFGQNPELTKDPKGFPFAK